MTGASKPGDRRGNVLRGDPEPEHVAPHVDVRVENRAVDPAVRLEAEMRAIADWAGRHVLDIGCGTGFHLPRFAATAERSRGSSRTRTW